MPKQIQCKWCGKPGVAMASESLENKTILIFEGEHVFCGLEHYARFREVQPLNLKMVREMQLQAR